MFKKLRKYISLTFVLLIVACFFTTFTYITIYGIFNTEIDTVISTLNLMSDKDEPIEKLAYMEILSDGSKLIQNYPSYGKDYGKIAVPDVEITMPIYFGDSLEILKKGSGHMTGSYFPGEGSSIIIGAHHSKDKFGKLQDVKLGDKINITTSYGKFSYNVYDLKVINETDLELLPIQKEKEVLMLYTCYPFGYLGYTVQRYVVYADLEEYEIYDEVK